MRGLYPTPSSETQLTLLWRCRLLQHMAYEVLRKRVLREGGGEGILQGTFYGQAWKWMELGVSAELHQPHLSYVAPTTCKGLGGPI